MTSIIVTIPKNKLKQVEQEESEVAKRIAAGEKDICYYWVLSTEPLMRVKRIYFVWNGAIRAYHEILGFNRIKRGSRKVKVYMKPEIHNLKKPIPKKGFRGWRYFYQSEEV